MFSASGSIRQRENKIPFDLLSLVFMHFLCNTVCSHFAINIYK